MSTPDLNPWIRQQANILEEEAVCLAETADDLALAAAALARHDISPQAWPHILIRIARFGWLLVADQPPAYNLILGILRAIRDTDPKAWDSAPQTAQQLLLVLESREDDRTAGEPAIIV